MSVAWVTRTLPFGKLKIAPRGVPAARAHYKKEYRPEQYNHVMVDILLCKIEFHLHELNLDVYDGHTCGAWDIVVAMDEKNKLLDVLAEEAAHCAAAYFDYNKVVLPNQLHKDWILSMVYHRTSVVHMEHYNLEPME